MVLLEAMAAGVPVVTTAVGGIPAVVSPGEAWLVEPGDVPGIARALSAALDGGPEIRERTAAARRRLHRDHAVAPWARRYDDVYAALVRRAPARGSRPIP